MAERVHIQINDRFHCRKETFVRLTFEEPFNRELHEFLGFRHRTVVRRSDDEASGEIRQRIEYETGIKVPWVVRPLAGREWVAYWEEQVFDPEALVLSTELEPMILKGRIQSTGVMRFEDDAEPGWMRRTYDIDVAVAVPFAGRPIAKRIVADVRDSYDRTATFVGDYLDKHDLKGK